MVKKSRLNKLPRNLLIILIIIILVILILFLIIRPKLLGYNIYNINNCPNKDFLPYYNIDTDNDKVPDLCDNCVTIKNPGQEDFDEDSIGNACDFDGGKLNADKDSLPDDNDPEPHIARQYFTDFVRGNVDGSLDGRVTSRDITKLQSFLTGSRLPCLDAADVNDDGLVNSVDLLYLQSFLVRTGPAPKFPYPVRALDPTKDNLGCEDSPRTTGILTVTINPSGSGTIIYIDNIKKAITTDTKSTFSFTLQEGDYNVRVDKIGYVRFSSDVRVLGKEKIKLNIVLTASTSEPTQSPSPSISPS